MYSPSFPMRGRKDPVRFLWGGHLVQRVRIASLNISSSSLSLSLFVCCCWLEEGLPSPFFPSFGIEGAMRVNRKDGRRILVALRFFVD